MKKFVVCILVCSLVACVAAPAYCAGPVQKLSRGFSNMLTFPCEIPNQISLTYEQNGLTAAMSYGVLMGIFMTGARALVGVYETATFFIPAPGGFEPILTNPEFFFDTPWQ